MEQWPVSLRNASRLLVLIASVFVSSAAAVEACSCMSLDVSVPCELYQKAPVAFVGRVLDWPPGGAVRFQVRRTLKGVAGGELSVLNQDSGVGCGYPFTVGAEYLVFAARRKDGQIEIPGCSTTIWALGWGFDPAGAFVESLGRPATGGRIYGEVELLPPVAGSPDPWWKKPVDGAIAILRGGGRERRVPTVKGRYEFAGLPPGVYNVSVSMPAGRRRAARASRSAGWISRSRSTWVTSPSRPAA